MPNPVTLHGASRSYVIDCTRTNAICALEEASGLPFATILRRLAWKRPPRRLVHQFLHAALIESVPLSEIPAVLADIGGPAVITAAVRPLIPTRRDTREIAYG